jgi:MtN3 and saliva related transmembrane protein
MAALIEAVGFCAAALTTFAFLPQVVRAIRTRSVGDLSAAMILTQGSGNALWVLYAIGTASVPLAVANALTLLLVGSLAVMKLRKAPTLDAA